MKEMRHLIFMKQIWFHFWVDSNAKNPEDNGVVGSQYVICIAIHPANRKCSYAFAKRNIF